MRRYLSALFILSSIFLQAQYSSLKSAYSDVFLYKITDEEAADIYKNGIETVDESYFHHVVSRFQTINDFEIYGRDTLQYGHYLLAKATHEKIHYEIRSIQNCEVKIFNNSHDLTLRILNTDQKAVSSAVVHLAGHKIQYNNTIEAYFIPNGNKDGILQVNYDGQKNFFKLKKTQNNNIFKKISRVIVKCKPLLEIFNAIRFIAYIPYHLIKYRRNVNSHGAWTLRKIDNHFNSMKNKKEYLLNPNSFPVRAFGYMILNKPKFRENDTIKLAAHLIDQYNKPINRTLSLYIEIGYGRNHKKIKIADLPASSKGLYSYDFSLSKTLGLTPDNMYQLILYDRNRAVIRQEFRYEQYNLNALSLTVNYSSKNHNARSELELKLITKDENNLPVKGGKYHLKIRAKNLTKFYQDEAHVPNAILDTIFASSQTGTTTFDILPSMLPKVDMNYTVEVTYNNWNTEKTTKTENFYYKYHSEKKEQQKIEREIIVNGSITKGELLIQTENPDSLYFSYFFYRNDKEILKGYGQSFEYSKRKITKQSYTICLQYMRNGIVYDPCYNIQNNLQEINFEVNHPEKIIPGETVEITVKATDYKNKPVKGLYITAHSLTSRFGYENARIYFHRSNKRRAKMLVHNSYEKNEINRKNLLDMEYEFWNNALDLEKLEYYNFRFPKDSIYTNYKKLQDRTSQVAPFVFDDGVLQPIQYVYIDYLPVYFGWSYKQPYSFHAREGYRKIGIRTTTHFIEIDSVKILPNEKLILSVDLHECPSNVSVKEVGKHLTRQEKSMVYPHTIGFDDMNFTAPSFIYNADTSKVVCLPRNNIHSPVIFGPIVDEHRTFEILDKLNERFTKEGGYSFKISKGYSRLKDLKKKMPTQLSYPFNMYLNDYAYNKRDMENIIDDYYLNINNQNLLRNFRYYSPSNNETGNLRLKLEEENVKLFVLIPADFSSGIYFSYTPRLNFQRIQSGKYRLLVVYQDNTCLLHESITVKNDHQNYYEISNEKHQISAFSTEIDSLLDEILTDRTRNKEENKKLIRRFKSKLFSTYSYPLGGKVIMGYIHDEYGEPIIGASVLVKSIDGRTLKGCVSDFNGKFQFVATPEISSIEIQYLGMKTKVLEIEYVGMLVNPLIISMTEYGDVLDEVCIKAYKVPLIDFDMSSSMRTVTAERISKSPLKNIQALSAQAAGISIDNGRIAIRGARSSSTQYYLDGVRITDAGMKYIYSEILTETIIGDEARKVYGADTVFLITRLDSLDYQNDVNHGLRSNFSDEGFWIPFLQTDKKGEVTFQATFPDDITKWSVHVVGYNEKQLSGASKTFVYAYKPLQTKLEVPKFLIPGDSIHLFSQIQKYEADSIEIESKFHVNDSLQIHKKLQLKYAVSDTMIYQAKDTSSVDIKHSIKLAKGYYDGEKRSIPIIPQGLERVFGEFKQLDGSTSFQLPDSITNEDYEIFIESNELQIMRREIRHLRAYKYLCNEQLASKILAMLHEKQYCKMSGETFRYEEDITKAITMLESRFSKQNYWGWWGNSRYNSWVSNHVIKAISKAKQLGYSIKIDYYNMLYSLAAKIEEKPTKQRAIDMMNTMSMIDTSLSFDRYFAYYDTIKAKSFQEELAYLRLKKSKKKAVDIGFLDSLLQRTMLGELYINNPYPNQVYKYSIRNNKLHNTIEAIWLYYYDSPSIHKGKIEGLKRYLISQRKNGYWRNTYTSAEMIDVIWTMHTAKSERNVKTKVRLRGVVDTVITSFPFSMKFSAGDKVIIEKKGSSSAYFTAYAKKRIPNPTEKQNDFKIQTSIEPQEKDRCNIKVEVEVLLQAKYVMIEVPIPAGMQYSIKSTGRYPEVHRGHYDEKVSIFCEIMEPGKYIFEVPLKNKFKGNFTINPAKIELMYFPTFYGNTKIKNINI